jgi:hypothetical protein
MSLDYPNRADWLAFREKRPSSTRYLHVSCSGIKHTPGYSFSTYNVGRNKAKRLKRK